MSVPCEQIPKFQCHIVHQYNQMHFGIPLQCFLDVSQQTIIIIILLLSNSQFNIHVHAAVACITGAWNQWAKERTARERETHEGRGSACMEGPRKSFSLAFCECGYFQLVDQQYMDNVVRILHNTPLAPENTKLYSIQVQVSEVTSICFNGTMWL